MIYETRERYESDDERMSDRFAERPAMRLERIARKPTDLATIAALQRFWGVKA